MICIFACMVIVADSLISLFNNTLRMFIVLPFKLDTIVIYLVIALIAVSSLGAIFKRSSLQVYIIIYVLFVVFIISFLLNGFYFNYYIKLGTDLFINAAPWLAVTYAVRDFRLYKKYLYFSALIIMVSFILNIFLFRSSIINNQSYSQQYTYMLLPTTVILADSIFNKINIINIALFLISLIFMFSMGSRGPIACVCLFILLRIILFFSRDLKKACMFAIPVAAIISMVYVYFYNILSFLLSIFEKMNFSTRSINKLLEGTFFQDSARDKLIGYSIDLIAQNPLVGVGLGKDRILLASRMGSNDPLSEAVGWYPHNIVLEILLHFGVIAGSTILLYLIRLLFISIFRAPDEEMSETICIFAGIGLFPLFFSGSYLDSPLFFALLGFCIFAYRSFKNSKSQNSFKTGKRAEKAAI